MLKTRGHSPHRCSENIDFITIRADHLYGRQVVIGSHLDVLANFYKGSTNHFNVQAIRMLRSDVALAQIRAVLESPSSPLEGTHEATYSLVLLKEHVSWEATAFHITLATPTPEHWLEQRAAQAEYPGLRP